MGSSGNSFGAKRLRRAVFGTAGLKFFYLATQFATGVLLARLLGAETLGVYAFYFAVIQVIAIVAQAGFPLYLVRAVARARESNDIAGGTALTASAICVVIFVSFLIYGALYCLKDIFAVEWFVNNSEFYSAVYLILPLAMIPTIAGALKGAGKIIQGQIPDLAVRPILFFFLVGGIYYLGSAVTVAEVFYVQFLALLVALVVALFSLSLEMKFFGRQALVSVRPIRALKSGSVYLLLAGAQVINYQTSVLLLGILASPTEVGLYRVGLQVSDALGVVLFAVSAVIAPQIARFHAREDWASVQRLVVISHRAAAAALLPFTLLAVFYGEEMLVLILGADYQGASEALTILVLGKLFYATVGFSGIALSMLGRPGVAAVVTFSSLLVNILLGLLLVPDYGAIGAAISTALSLLIVNVVSLRWMRSRTGRGFSAFARIKSAVKDSKFNE